MRAEFAIEDVLANITINRGVFSTIFLWMVDVPKSRVECQEFVRAEADRKAFD